MPRFAPLCRCPGLEHDDDPCDSRIDPNQKQMCSACQRRETEHNPRRKLPKPAEQPVEMVECCGPDGLGCRHRRRVPRRKTKGNRCATCAVIFKQQRREAMPEWKRQLAKLKSEGRRR